jgi:glutamyl-tRNA synthetase
LLGWSPGDDREFFDLDEMARLFEISRVNASPARFDLKKCTAINGDWIRSLSTQTLAHRLQPFLAADGIVSDPATLEQQAILSEVIPLIQERLEVLSQAGPMVRFLLVDESVFEIEESEIEGLVSQDAQEVLEVSERVLRDLPTWHADDIQAALRSALVEGLGRKPKHAFGPVRVAITGRRVSPPLFESMEIVGRERSLARIHAALR